MSKYIYDTFDFAPRLIWEDPKVEIYYLFELLIAPKHVVYRQHYHSYWYSESLVEYFEENFPELKDYEIFLDRSHYKVSTYINDLKTSDPTKKKVLELLNELKNQVDNLCIEVNGELILIKSNPFVLAAGNFYKKMRKLVYDSIDKTRLTPESVIEHSYYLSNCHLSWSQNPFAFFIDLLYGDGFETIKSDWEEYVYMISKAMPEETIESAEEYISDVLKSQAYLSATIMISEIEKQSFKKQMAISKACQQIDEIYSICIINGWLPKYCKSFALTVSEIQKKYKPNKFKYPIKNFTPNEVYFMPFMEDDFIECLMNLSVIDRQLGNVLLIDKNTEPDELKSFFLGNYQLIKRINFDWPKESVFYLIIELLKLPIKPLIKFPEKKYENKIFIQNESFNRDSFYTYRSELKKSKENKPPHYEIIDKLISKIKLEF